MRDGCAREEKSCAGEAVRSGSRAQARRPQARAVIKTESVDARERRRGRVRVRGWDDEHKKRSGRRVEEIPWR